MAKFYDEEGREVIFFALETGTASPIKTVKPTIITRNAPPTATPATNRDVTKKYLRPKELKEVYGVSEHKMMELAKEAKAIYKVDKVVMIKVEKLEQYLETFLIED